ncbi:hypothetical protein TOPH_07851 [Tolypocladium ophioglossoides CBS 100239]|uniref:Uncharacterized protein n=1 Tax=Tolypocladium ophioglossoides (strain CBS 100239) TaxID=1163406 RepID=A0A0L0N1B1_TOLOC|nr:hypothetical protein TOPH_07851 [Tolypocladium ophioglossoides CBS 100239]
MALGDRKACSPSPWQMLRALRWIPCSQALAQLAALFSGHLCSPHLTGLESVLDLFFVIYSPETHDAVSSVSLLLDSHHSSRIKLKAYSSNTQQTSESGGPEVKWPVTWSVYEDMSTSVQDTPGKPPGCGEEVRGVQDRQAQRSLLRRERDCARRFERQVARGRPGRAWRQCEDVSCTSPHCRYDDPSSALRDRSKNRDGVPVSDIWASFAREICRYIFPEECPSSIPGPKHTTVRSFSTSPQVRFAFLQFRESCVARQLEPSDKTMREELGSLLPKLRRHLSAVGDADRRPPIHLYLGSEPGGEDKARSLRDICMQFLLRIEMWRHSQHGRFRDWSFGRWGELAEVLATLLLQLWVMDREGCFDTEEGINGQRWDELWDEWLDENPWMLETAKKQQRQPASEPRRGGISTRKDRANEGGHITGLGRLEPPWWPPRERPGDMVRRDPGLPEH